MLSIAIDLSGCFLGAFSPNIYEVLGFSIENKVFHDSG